MLLIQFADSRRSEHMLADATMALGAPCLNGA
jgi:hypothetical protein